MRQQIEIPADYLLKLPGTVRGLLALPDSSRMAARLTVHLPTGRVACVCMGDVHVLHVDADGTTVRRVWWEQVQ